MKASQLKQSIGETAYSGIRLNTVKNICWSIGGGGVTFVYFCLIGVVYGITIIGAKKAYMCFKFALYTLMPFGKQVATDYPSHKMGNTFWLVTTGWQIALFCVIASGITYATYIGRHLGAKWFHLAQFVIAPFGAKISEVTLLGGAESAIAPRRDRDSEYEL